MNRSELPGRFTEFDHSDARWQQAGRCACLGYTNYDVLDVAARMCYERGHPFFHAARTKGVHDVHHPEHLFIELGHCH